MPEPPWPNWTAGPTLGTGRAALLAIGSRLRPMIQHRYEVFFSCPLPSGGRDSGIDEVVAANRHEALELAAQSHPHCSLAAFHSALIPTSRRRGLLADWLQTV